MSNIFPREVAEAIRKNTDKLVDTIGQECNLFRVTQTATDGLGDHFIEDIVGPIPTKVLIHWSPEVRRLKELGLYTEEPHSSIPILAYFKFEDDPKQGDYVELEYEYSVGDIKTNKFDVVDRKLRGQGAEARSVWVLAPKRS